MAAKNKVIRTNYIKAKTQKKANLSTIYQWDTKNKLNLNKQKMKDLFYEV